MPRRRGRSDVQGGLRLGDTHAVGAALPALSRALLIARARHRRRRRRGRRQDPALELSRRRRRRDARALARGARGAAAGRPSPPKTNSATAWSPTAARWCATCWRSSALDRLETVRFTAANDYFVDIPTSDFRDYDAILAMEADGKKLSRREKGPLWLMYPISDHPELQRPDLHAPADLAGGADRGAVTSDAARSRATSGSSVLLAMAGFAAVGFFAIRRDVENLRVISQDNIQWSASQMEIELLRFQLSLAELRHRRRRPKRSRRCTSASTSSGAGSS